MTLILGLGLCDPMSLHSSLATDMASPRRIGPKVGSRLRNNLEMEPRNMIGWKNCFQNQHQASAKDSKLGKKRREWGKMSRGNNMLTLNKKLGELLDAVEERNQCYD